MIRQVVVKDQRLRRSHAPDLVVPLCLPHRSDTLDRSGLNLMVRSMSRSVCGLIVLLVGGQTAAAPPRPLLPRDPYLGQVPQSVRTMNAEIAAELAGFDPLPVGDDLKVDLMVVVAHPDDESTFGGLLPYYTRCRGKSVAFVCLTSGCWGDGLPHQTSPAADPDYSYNDDDVPRFSRIPAEALYPCYWREAELARMLKVSGVKIAPVLPRFTDMTGFANWGQPDDAWAYWGGGDRERGRAMAVDTIVHHIRRFRPDVVVTMAFDGYNGNPIHLGASRAAIEACEVSGDRRETDRQQNETAETPPPWSVKKLYLAVSEGESYADAIYDAPHVHSWEFACEPDRTAQQIAADANAEHASQKMPRECSASTTFVLKLSRVGPDLVGRDNLFENVD